ncbi:hypothetical protein GH714_023635 [Hevea brasiliensis]|uniref:Alpha-ketoglutarate-dependent dioxygenase AlkB-like domain-containing protein n=1 Tax=Hevea brasiliensis TaxID=3981 RepID=A0A6A6LD15_HEVBR|nr:hypothetical protein GH714_023635 [Hevea brasiliensis]
MNGSLMFCLFHMQGICAHVDLMRFEDGIAIVSLESSCVMHFTQVGEDCENGKGENDQPMPRVPVHLTRGSVVLLWGDARYLWKHEINRKPGFQMWGEGIKSKEENIHNLEKTLLYDNNDSLSACLLEQHNRGLTRYAYLNMQE